MFDHNRSLKIRLFSREHWVFYTISVIGFIFIYEPALLRFQELFYGTKMPKGWNNVTRDVRHFIEPGETKIIVHPKNVCTEKIYLLIIVCSAVRNFEARQTIRNTWANKTFIDAMRLPTVKVVFFLGESRNDIYNDAVDFEGKKHNDIIQEKFHDTYNNLTLKLVSLLKYATTYCKKSKYIMKVDDDTFTNVNALVRNLLKIPDDSEVLIGAIHYNARPVKDSTLKWYMPKIFFSQRRYPTYLSGSGYVMSFNVAVQLYKVALSTPMIHLEDVYITGFCAKIAGIKPIHHEGFGKSMKSLLDTNKCLLFETITLHEMDTELFLTVWKKFKYLYEKKSRVNSFCNSLYTSFFQLRVDY